MPPEESRVENQDAVISTFVERVQQEIRGLLPRDRVDAVMDQLRRALRQGFSDLDLVPRRELEAHLATVDRLTRTVEDLERRIRALEDQ
jgi:BMFP domain-containing protein YqiC